MLLYVGLYLKMMRESLRADFAHKVVYMHATDLRTCMQSLSRISLLWITLFDIHVQATHVHCFE